MLKLLAFVALLSIPALCRTSNNCLWLNETTAAGILNGAVTSQVVTLKTPRSPVPGTPNATSSAGPMNANPYSHNYALTAADDEDCTFQRRRGSVFSEIRIEVRTMYDSRVEFSSRLAGCSHDAKPLRAIGNEAVSCIVERKGLPPARQIIGRVRDRVFLVRLTASDSPAESATVVAQIVSGNLF